MASSNLAIIVKMVDQASGPLKQVESSVHGLTGAIGNIGTAAAGIAGGLLAFGAVSSAMDFVKGAAIGLNSTLQQNEVAFTTMLGSADAAKKHLDELASFAAKTPFEFPDVVNASKKLQGMGIQASKVTPLLTAIGDAAAAMGGGAQSVDRITTALGQMNAKGKATGEEIMQLTEAGIPAWDMLAKKLGVDVATAMEKVSKGTVSADTMLTAFQEGSASRFGGMMAAQSKTFDGAMSTLKDTLSQATAKGFKPFFDAATTGLVKLNDLMAKPEFNAFVDRIANGMASVATWMIGVFERDVPRVLSTASVWFNRARSALEKIREVVDGVAERVKSALTPAMDGAKGAFDKAQPVIDGVKTVLNDVWNIIKDLIKSGDLGLLNDNMREAFGIDVQPAITAIQNWAKEIKTTFGEVSETAGRLADALGPVVQTGLNTAKTFWDRHGDEIKGAVSSSYGKVGFSMSDKIHAANALVNAGLTGIEKGWAEHGDSIQEKAGRIWEGVNQAISTVLNVVVPFVVGQFEKIRAWVDENWPLIQQTVETVMAGIFAAVDSFLGFVLKFWEDHGATIMTVVNTIWTVISTVVSTAIDIILGVIKTVMLMINGDWAGAWESIKDTLGKAWEGIKTIVVSLVTGVLVLLWDLVASLGRMAWDLFMAALRLGGRILDGIMGGVASLVGKVVGTVTDVVNGITNKAADMLNAASTLGKKILDGIMNGISTLVADVKRKVEDAVNGVKDFAGRFWDEAKNLGANLVNGLVNGVSSLGDQLRSAITNVLDNISITVGWLHIDKNGISFKDPNAGSTSGGNEGTQSAGGAVLLGRTAAAVAMSSSSGGLAAGTVINWSGNIIVNGAASPRETATTVRAELLRMSRRTTNLGLL